MSRYACVHGSHPLERHAAEQFCRYATEIAGDTIVATVAPPQDNTVVLFSIGTTHVAEELADQDLLTLPFPCCTSEGREGENEAQRAGGCGDSGKMGARCSGGEAFIVVSTRRDNQPIVVLTGQGPVGSLYAMYHYLESFCGVGFFWDGDQIPRLEELPSEKLYIVERPRFPIREYMMDCEYTSYWWGWPEWKREVDWAAKHRFNVLSSNFDFTATWRTVWKAFDVDVPESSVSAPPYHPWAGWHKWNMYPHHPVGFQDFQDSLCRRFTSYGRSLGMLMAPDYRGFIGQVPEEFYEKYRNSVRFIEVDWAGFSPPGKFIHPSDPMYRKVYRAFIEEYIRRFGTDRLYAAMTFSEMVPGDTPEEQKTIKREGARAVWETIRTVDPDATLFTQSWTWLNRKLWPEEEVQAYLDLFPDDRIQVWELWDDQKASFNVPPMYKELQYYYGKPWLLGFIHSYGGTTLLHGDLAGLIIRIQEAAFDPKAGKCEGISIQPEALHHDFIYFDPGWYPGVPHFCLLLEAREVLL